ncbi:MAG: LacI family DNA-binding transcriptional regulator [Pseudomonadota bacterium]
MPSDKPLPTLHDVARAAGVSTATVSRCLNTPDKVVERTRKKVLAAVETLGYSPNFGARIMAAKRTRTMGAIIPTMDNAIFARGLQAFQETLLQAGYSLVVASSLYDPAQEAAQVRTLVARGAEGLLLIGQDRDAAIHQFLATQNVPAIAAWCADADAPLPSVGFDNRLAMKALAHRVIQLGHARIAMISAPVAGNDRARMRVHGVREAMADAGLGPDSLTVVEAAYEIQAGAEAFDQLMQRRPRPTVVICGNDVQAVGATTMARQMRLSVPRDVSVTGFDDMDLAHVSVPPLTTVQVPHHRMGRDAAQLLVQMVEGGTPGRTIPLDAPLKERASLGAVPRR